MDNKDKERFSKALLVMAQYFEKELNSMIIRLYFEGLERFDIDQVENGISKAIQTLRFMPKVIDIIELMPDGAGKVEDRGVTQGINVVRAIKRFGVYNSVKFEDPFTAAIINQVFGGWIKLCTELLWVNEKWFLKDFEKYYRSYHNGNIKYTDHLPGLIEYNNFQGGFDDQIPPAILVDKFLSMNKLEYEEEMKKNKYLLPAPVIMSLDSLRKTIKTKGG